MNITFKCCKLLWKLRNLMVWWIKHKRLKLKHIYISWCDDIFILMTNNFRYIKTLIKI